MCGISKSLEKWYWSIIILVRRGEYNRLESFSLVNPHLLLPSCVRLAVKQDKHGGTIWLKLGRQAQASDYLISGFTASDENFKFPALRCPFWQCGNTASGLAGLYLNLILSSPMTGLIFLSQSSSYTLLSCLLLLLQFPKNMFFFSLSQR